jgi:hypothetical protein
VAKRSLVDRVAAPVLAARPIARSDGDDHARLVACADDDVLRLRRAMDEVPCPQTRSSPSTISSASPETTRKSSWSASQWYIAMGSPGPSTYTAIPSCGNSGSPSKSQAAPRPSRSHQRVSRAFRTNQPSPVGMSRYIHLFDQQRTDEAVRQAMSSGFARS